MAESYYIRCRYHGSLCRLCGCPIPKGSEILYTPKDTARNIDAVVEHADEAQCGSEYVVHVIFHTTRKQVIVKAYTAADAIAQVQANPKKKYFREGIPQDFRVGLRQVIQ